MARVTIPKTIWFVPQESTQERGLSVVNSVENLWWPKLFQRAHKTAYRCEPELPMYYLWQTFDVWVVIEASHECPLSEDWKQLKRCCFQISSNLGLRKSEKSWFDQDFWPDKISYSTLQNWFKLCAQGMQASISLWNKSEEPHGNETWGRRTSDDDFTGTWSLSSGRGGTDQGQETTQR